MHIAQPLVFQASTPNSPRTSPSTWVPWLRCASMQIKPPKIKMWAIIVLVCSLSHKQGCQQSEKQRKGRKTCCCFSSPSRKDKNVKLARAGNRNLGEQPCEETIYTQFNSLSGLACTRARWWQSIRQDDAGICSCVTGCQPRTTSQQFKHDLLFNFLLFPRANWTELCVMVTVQPARTQKNKIWLSENDTRRGWWEKIVAMSKWQNEQQRKKRWNKSGQSHFLNQ